LSETTATQDATELGERLQKLRDRDAELRGRL